MTTRLQAEATIKSVWQWPVDLTTYDRTPLLTEEEYTALLSLGWHTRQARCYDPDRPEWAVIERLFRPLNEARLGLYIPDKQYHQRSSRDAVALILHACATTRKAFWGWNTATWIDVFGPDHKTIQERFPGWVDGAVRPYMFGIAYLLNCFSEIHQLGKNNNVTLATRLFGPALVDAAVDPILSTLEGWGYQSARHTATVPGLVCTLLLLNRSPHLADMTTDRIEHYRHHDQIPKNFRSSLYGVHRALAALGFVETPASYIEAQAPVVQGVDPAWLDWVERWTTTSTLTPKVRQMYRCILLKVGRWLASEHPQIREPAQ